MATHGALRQMILQEPSVVQWHARQPPRVGLRAESWSSRKSTNILFYNITQIRFLIKKCFLLFFTTNRFRHFHCKE